ncbi:hypothetical protein GL218_00374 [Daldinia childiae]|uniref:uncharacterized protein n=1 Tax=Daldinia childiae TaxID=326645 RepID=UPI001444D631|nr:uncharacterized protein GL218_00374 [Daldinia childiae]KAF3070459.1 hypothetical protein GL218_00374 [Daldinia childiae]
MPPNQSTSNARGRGSSGPAKSRASASSTSGPSRARKQAQATASDGSDADPFAEDERSQQRRRTQDTMDLDEDEAEEEERKTIPPELLTHVLHQFFEKDGTRVSKDANAAIAKYMDIFVREAIARTVVEKEKGFLEVEDLEKIAPQLLLDL